MKKTGFLIIIAILSLACINTSQGQELTLAYYNTDNFFNTADDSPADDDEWALSGSLGWTIDKFNDKSSRVAGIINSVLIDSPGIIILSEIENREVAENIAADRKLRRAGYKVIWPDSGTRFAIITKEGLITVMEHKLITNELVDQEDDDAVLYLKCMLNDNNIYHLFLNDWPARSANGDSGSALRMGLSAAVRKAVDNILNFERDARIIIAGTFNEEPTYRSIMNILGAANKKKNLGYRDLYNLYYDIHNEEGKGTTMLNGVTQMFDYFIISPSLLKDAEGYGIDRKEAGIFSVDKSDYQPVLQSGKLSGGVSGHLPVFIRLKLKQPD